MSLNINWKSILIAGIILSSSILAQGKDIFVYASNDGGQNGTYENAYKTIQQAADAALPGDIIKVRTGVYREEVNIPVNNLTFTTNESDKVVINGAEKISTWTLCTLNNDSYSHYKL